MNPDCKKLDNPAWYSMAEGHPALSTGDEEVKRYRPEIVAFTACRSEDKIHLLDRVMNVDEFFFLIGDPPALPVNYIIENSLPCEQMITISRINLPVTVTIEKLDESQAGEMFDLVSLVQPGYYKRDTRMMGEYYGIRQNGQLVSLAGERMRMAGFIEISAVVTHPGFSGRGYAQQLMMVATNAILEKGSVPLLHVVQTNRRAIDLYKYLGFTPRRSIHFTRIRRVG